ncbi:MAG: hypothetical protein OQJ96_10375 [Flavobacteriales bacterium]|nr:hypothetical protein [Flavobacteriales bacterium]MCW8913436.1 hypothetical protein [Flavobacteriales bacterium]MCW8938500.1 hypothetical protein [Flavobacteriales bacterium]MCW8967481.1 hypothetical protein [Flavobacteriales bacterium]MCW8990277.1 hypothetical protein [Flavobacteriales bacterium]
MNYYDNEEIIFNSEFQSKKLNFNHGKKINESIVDIKLDGTEDIYYKGESENEQIDFKFQNLIKKSGWIHFNNGASFKINKGLIKEVKLYNDSLGKLKHLNSDEIKSKIGKPSKIEHDIITYVFDPVDEGDIYHFKDRHISIQFDPDTDKIKEIRIK